MKGSYGSRLCFLYNSLIVKGGQENETLEMDETTQKIKKPNNQTDLKDGIWSPSPNKPKNFLFFLGSTKGEKYVITRRSTYQKDGQTCFHEMQVEAFNEAAHEKRNQDSQPSCHGRR